MIDFKKCRLRTLYIYIPLLHILSGHTSSEAHQRQLLLFSDNSGKFLDSFSQEFESNFMNLLKRCHGTKRTFANQVYQEYIKDKE